MRNSSWEIGSTIDFAGDLLWAPEGKWDDATKGADPTLTLTCNLVGRAALTQLVRDHLGSDVKIGGVERDSLLQVTIPIDRKIDAWSRPASFASAAEAGRRELAHAFYQLDPLHGKSLEVTITYQGQPVAHARATHKQIAAATAAMNRALTSAAGRTIPITELDAIYLGALSAPAAG